MTRIFFRCFFLLVREFRCRTPLHAVEPSPPVLQRIAAFVGAPLSLVFHQLSSPRLNPRFAPLFYQDSPPSLALSHWLARRVHKTKPFVGFFLFQQSRFFLRAILPPSNLCRAHLILSLPCAPFFFLLTSQWRIPWYFFPFAARFLHLNWWCSYFPSPLLASFLFLRLICSPLSLRCLLLLDLAVLILRFCPPKRFKEFLSLFFLLPSNSGQRSGPESFSTQMLPFPLPLPLGISTMYFSRSFFLPS